jgi:hypothetical protein
MVMTDNCSLSLVCTCLCFWGTWCSWYSSTRSAGPCGLQTKAPWSFRLLSIYLLVEFASNPRHKWFETGCAKGPVKLSALCYHLKAVEWLSDLCLVSRTSVKNILKHGCHKPSALECFWLCDHQLVSMLVITPKYCDHQHAFYLFHNVWSGAGCGNASCNRSVILLLVTHGEGRSGIGHMQHNL